MGWAIHPEHHRKGFGEEAVRLLLEYLFKERGLRRVTAACDARNVASRRLMERLGMRLEGEFLQSKRIGGEWRSRRENRCREGTASTGRDLGQ